VTELSEEGRRGNSLAKRFNLYLLSMYILTILVTTPVTYFVTKKQVYTMAKDDLSLMVDIVKSIQEYVATDLRPHFMEEEIYYSPSFSGIVATSKVAKYLKERQPKYYISNVSDNPLNPANKVKGIEAELLGDFRSNRDKKVVSTEGKINGHNYLVRSAPMVSKDGCLRCHGDPEMAPEDIKANFSAESGFGYKNGEVVGVSVVGVPLKDVQSLTVQRSLMMIGAITLLFSILFFVVNKLVKRLVLEPVLEITTVAVAVSHGDISREVSVKDRTDELAKLASSFELMRRSLVAAMKRMKRKTN
jgi:methyl-accepting chemotaxis protein